MLETDLYEPVRRLFEGEGYSVNAEVHNCDVVATKEEETIIVELKNSFNLKLVHQIIKRQTYADHVYAAIPRPGNLNSLRWAEVLALMKRLGAGIIVVYEVDSCLFAQIVLEPKEYNVRRNNKKRSVVQSEISKRSMECNVGGSTRTKLMTAYRENALFVACCLKMKGDMKPKDIAIYGTGGKTASILNKNFYKWFCRTDHGLYSLTKLGKQATEEYKSLSEHYYEKIQRNEPG